MSRANNPYRLTHRSEFLRFFNDAQVYRLPSCVIFKIPNPFGHYRLGITLKAKGMSVERNRVKRVIRTAFHELEEVLGSFDYNVVIPAHKKMKFPYPEGLRVDLVEKWPKNFAG